MSLDILAGFFLIFYTQCINAGAYFSGDTTITAFDNKTRSIQELKVLDQVLIIPNLALRKPEPANNNLAIDSTWQIATFNYLGNTINVAQPMQIFIQQGVIAKNKDGIFSKEKIFKLTGIRYLPEVRFILTNLAQVENSKDASNDNVQFITATIKYQSQSLTKYIFTDNNHKQISIICGDAVKVYAESQQAFIAIDQLAQANQSFQQNNQTFTFKSKEDAGVATGYMIEVNNMHHFYANGILVHNPDDPKDNKKEEKDEAKDKLTSLSDTEDQVDIMKISLEDGKKGVKY